MEKTFDLNIVTTNKAIYKGKIVSLVAPGEWGYLGVLADHAPLIAKLASGVITLREPQGDTKRFEYKGGGFLEVLHNRASLILSGDILNK